MLARVLFILCLALAPAPSHADNADRVRDYIVRELREDGYSEIRMSRTLLGRMRFVARRPDARREIVVNPRTGEILRDYVRFLRSGSSNDDDDDDDDDDEDEDDEDDDDEDDNSGSGSSNSGSGSSNSGSGSSDDEDDD